jgi:HlyD family secretion protein
MLAIAGCDTGSPATERAQKLKDPYPAKVERRDLIGYTMLAEPKLYVPPEAQAVVYPKYKAPVEQVMAAVGQKVNRGETLIQLNFPSAEAALEQTEADVKAAERAYANAREEYNEPVRQAEQALAQARKIEKDVRDQTQPGGDGSALQDAQAQRQAAEAAVMEAKRSVGANLDIYKDQVNAAREAMAQAKQGVRQGSMRSPIAGTVTFLDVRAGQMVGEDARKPLVKIVDLGQIEVKATIPSDFSVNIEVGKAVTMGFIELPDRVFDGKITRVSVVPGNDGAAKEITIDFRNDEGLVKEGFKPDWVGVKVGEVKQVLAVPKEAIDIDATGKPMVKVLEGENWVARVVELGMSDGKYTEIKSGLKEGETVQVTPEERVK